MGKGEGGLCLIWEGSLSHLEERDEGLFLIWEGSLSYLEEREGGLCLIWEWGFCHQVPIQNFLQHAVAYNRRHE